MDERPQLDEERARAQAPGAAPSPRSAPLPAAAQLPPPQPGTLVRAWPPFFHLALFGLTFASALLAGLLLEESAPEGANLLPALGRALAFAASLLGILLAHEMGHFLLARRHRVDATWPYFLPAPLLSFIGTLGAVIRLRALPRTRRALVDIGAAGPIAGFLVAAPILYVGLALSRVVPAPAVEPWTLWDALVSWARTGEVPEVRDAIGFGEPLLLQWFERVRFGPLAPGTDLALHPVALAGWFGLLVTALNLLPLGQLDGGHLLYAVSPRLHRALGPVLSALLVGLGVFTPFSGWLLWGLVTGTVLSRHPPLREPDAPLGPLRAGVVLLSLAIFVLSFCPVPLAMLRA